MKKYLFALVLLAAPLFSQTAAVTGYCTQGASQALVQGLKSTNYQNGIIPRCTVTVYETGTTTKATLYSDAINTALGNPFTASPLGAWLFFTAVNQGYDVVLSGGTSPNTYASPVTLTSVFPLSNITIPTAGCIGQNSITNGCTGASTAAGAVANLVNGNPIRPSTVVSDGIVAAGATASDATGKVAPLVNRHYDAVVVSGSSIATSLAAITDASYTKRYKLSIPNGTYSDCGVQAKDYVDLVGQSTSGVVWTCTSGSLDALLTGGINMMVSNMTIAQTGGHYAIHHDALSSTGAPGGATTILFRVALSTNSGSAALGAGTFANQSFYVVDSSFTSTLGNGIWLHNTSFAQADPAQSYLVNNTVTAVNSGVCALQLGSTGSTQPDQVNVIGGTYTGPGGSVCAFNTPASGGAGEVVYTVDPSVGIPNGVVNTAGHYIAGPASLVINPRSLPGQSEYTGTIATSPSGLVMGPQSGISEATVQSLSPLAQWNSTQLGNTAGNYQLAHEHDASASSIIKHREWTYRASSGSDFTTVEWHDGFSVDTSYIVPHSTSRAWYGRTPYTGCHSWGDQVTSYATWCPTLLTFTLPATFTKAITNSLGTTAGGIDSFVLSTTVRRWGWGLGALETGGNAGSDYLIDRYADDGGFLDTPIHIYRDTGVVGMPDGARAPLIGYATGFSGATATCANGVSTMQVDDGTVVVASCNSAAYTGTVTCTAGQHVNSLTIVNGIITVAPTCN